MLASVETEEFAGGGVLPPHPSTPRTIPEMRTVQNANRGRRMGITVFPLGKRLAGLDPEALQYHRQRTESGKRGLQQIGTDERREPKPLDVHEMRQKQAQKHHSARESHYPAIDAHWYILIVSGKIVVTIFIILVITNLASIDFSRRVVYTLSVLTE